MRPAIHACLATAALAAAGGVWPARAHYRLISSPPVASAAASPSASVATLTAVCPRGSLPDGEACVPFDAAEASEGEELEARQNRHHDRHGALRVYDQIPRLPGRPERYEAYRYPIPTAEGERLLVSGYDLDRPDEKQRRGHGLKAVGHGGVDIMARRGTEVRALPLEHQEGDAEVLFVGTLFGTSVVTRHLVREAGRLRTYVVLHGHLDGAAPGLVRGARAPEGTLLGFVGDTGSEGIVHLHLEIRQARGEVDVGDLPPGKLMSSEQTVAVDPRNLLPLR
jgi:murein DD-endopeptidase MepM/ murein hydrolase activator NlpD